MSLDPKEKRLIEIVRGNPTAKITVTKHKGVIKAIHTEINAEIVDKAEGKGELWEKRAAIRVNGADVPRGNAENERTTREGGKE